MDCGSSSIRWRTMSSPSRTRAHPGPIRWILSISCTRFANTSRTASSSSSFTAEMSTTRTPVRRWSGAVVSWWTWAPMPSSAATRTARFPGKSMRIALIVYGLGNLIFETFGHESHPWHQGYLAKLTIANGHVRFEAIPYMQSVGAAGGAMKLTDDEHMEFMREMEGKSALLRDGDFLSRQVGAALPEPARRLPGHAVRIQPYDAKATAASPQLPAFEGGGSPGASSCTMRGTS